ncbi:thioredoxin family protein [Paenibacillus sp. P25]|nr:thioredoxin family protein [Paenibacillus sp. P25]
MSSNWMSMSRLPLRRAYGVMSMPTVILFKDGQPMEKLVGLRSKMTYLNLLNKLLS